MRPAVLVVRLTLLLALLVAGLLVATSPSGGGVGADERQVTRRGPVNLVVVVVDDMDDFSCAETEQYLPRSSRWLLDRGTCFEHATTTSPVCCPARATIQSGQVPHNSGVRRQIDAGRLDPRRTIQTRLGSAGLTTYAIGKYLNGVTPSSVIDGSFDSGFARTDLWSSDRYSDYVLYDDDAQPYTPVPPVHTTLRAGTYLRDFVTEMVDAEQPFYAQVGFAAPHTQNRHGAGFLFPAPTAANAARPVPRFRFRPERDTSDKLLPFRSVEPGHGRHYFARFHAARVRALYDVDDQVAATFDLLQATDALDETAVFFVSDNGYQLGSNGWEGKSVPYPDSLQVPMLAYYPPAFGAGVVDRRRVGLVDIAPTVFDLFGVRPGYWLDGHAAITTPRGLHYPMGWGTLGGAFPAAIGAAVDAPAVAFMGDGGMLFALGELATVVQEDLPLVVVVLDDGGYGMLRFGRADQANGADLAPGDCAALARSFGMDATTVDGVADAY